MNPPARRSELDVPLEVRKVVEIWIHDFPPHTQRAYEGDVAAFVDLTGVRDLRAVQLEDLHRLEDELRAAGRKPSTVRRRLAGVKSLLSFAHRLGIVSLNVGAAKRAPKVDEDPPDRILRSEEVFRIFRAARSERDALLMRLLYYAGARADELVKLCPENAWSDDRGRGVLHLVRKGGKRGYVLIPAWLFADLVRFIGAMPASAPIFATPRSRERMSTRNVHRIVADAAKRAGVPGDVSPHWLRHAHISHALDARAPVHLVRETVGHASLATTGRYAHAKPDDSSALYLPTL